MGRTRNTLAHQIDSVTFIHQRIYRRNRKDMGFIVFKVVILQNRSLHLLKVVSILQLDVDISSVDTGSQRNGHRQGVLDTRFSLCRYRMTHAHAGSKVGIGDALWRTSFQQSTNHRVRARVPAGRNNRNGTGNLGCFVQFAVQLPNLCVDVKAVHGIDALCQIFLGIFFY